MSYPSPHAITATEIGVYWAAGMAEFSVLMSDASTRNVAVDISPEAGQAALRKAEAVS
jgi:hypothetical protein